MSLRPVTLWGFAAAATTAILAVALYERLPDAIPVHWGLSGSANGFASKPLGPFLLPVMVAALALLGTVLPAIAPRGFELSGFTRAFDLITLALVGFITFLALVIDAEALGVPVSPSHLIGIASGVLLIVLGNMMGKTRRNFFVGFRTPWTLSSEEVWSHTHRFGGRLLVVCGLGFCVTGAFGIDLIIPAAVTSAACVAIVVYSYFVYRRLGPEE
jgi:uncharacterized membrane protein